MNSTAVKGRQFVDTNVLVYAHDASAGAKRTAARLLLERLWISGDACASIQVLQEFYVSVTRTVPRRLDAREASQAVRDLSAWTLFVPQTDDVLAAIELHQRVGISFWDAMIVRSAAELDCAVIWSEDLNANQVYEGVPVMNPFARMS